MQYTGKLYGSIRGKFFDTSKTTEDWDRIELENIELKARLNDPISSVIITESPEFLKLRDENKEMRQILKDIDLEFEPMKILNEKGKVRVIEKAKQFLKRIEK